MEEYEGVTGGVRSDQIEAIRPFLETEDPNEDGEVGLYCLFHEDAQRSASLNMRTGNWYCFACGWGGSIFDLVARVADGVAPPQTNGHSHHSNGRKPTREPEELSEGKVAGWHSALLSSEVVLERLQDLRGLSLDTLIKYQIGWDPTKRAYTIPVRDEEGYLRNVRRYKPDASEGFPKIWSAYSHGAPLLYPIQILDGAGEVIICEGEWDALLTIQNGFRAVTRTGAARVWKQNWNEHFEDKLVYVCHDMDDAGQAANSKVQQALKDVSREVRVLCLPYEITPKHGKDLTDFWQDGYNALDLSEIMLESQGELRDPEVVEREFVDVSVIDSFDAEQAGRKLRMRVTITGKRTPTFLVPKLAEYTCTMDAGPKCMICPMLDLKGKAVRSIDGHDQMILEMLGASSKQVQDLLRDHMGAQKCGRLTIEPLEQRSVEKLYVRPAVDAEARIGEAGDYTNREIVSVGRHDSLPNNTVEVVGTIYPNPRTQHNEFQAWEVSRTETSIDTFAVTEDNLPWLLKFQPIGNQRPLKKLGEIARDYAAHVTKIYGRNEMHALLDLVWHSVLAFNFGGSLQTRGWLEAIVVGDTRTGKSEAAGRLVQHLGAGEMVSCESASFAGIVGGLQQYGSGREWEITWGAIPINDRRLVVLDEVSGLAHEGISQMSSIRSSGEAQLTKIRSERTWARTRLVWLGNPRGGGRLSDYTYGVQALQPLIGNNEDIARFDLAMSVGADEVDPNEINRSHSEAGDQVYEADACRELLLWCWSRKADQVVWSSGAESEVFRQAVEVGKRYTEKPPLVQSANVRMKIARIAAALAARTFSTDDTYENVVVTKLHVEDAVKFMDILYDMPGFGYAEMSREQLQDAREAQDMRDAARNYLLNERRGLAKFLRTTSTFVRTDLEEMLNLSREEAGIVIQRLWQMRMVTRQGGKVQVNSVMQDIIREVKE